MKQKHWFFEKNKQDQQNFSQINQIIKLRDKKGDITTGTNKIQKIL
jgi:hypothetical protein